MNANDEAVESESALIGAVCLQGDAIVAAACAARLSGRHFAVRWRGDVWDAAAALYAKGRAADCPTICAELKSRGLPPPEGVDGWAVALASAMDAALPLHGGNVAWHCERIKKCAHARAVAAALRAAAETAGKGDVDAAMAAMAALREQGGDAESAKTVWGDIRQVMGYRVRCFKAEDYKALNAPGVSVLRSGLVTVGAEANTGKSSLASSIVLDVVRHDPGAMALMYSLDDSPLITGKRILSQLARRNLFAQADGFAADEHAAVLDRIVVRDYFSITGFEGEARALLRRLKCKRLVMVLDYLQIVAPPSGDRRDRREFFNDVVKELKEAQKRLEAAGHDCLVLLLSQLTRSDGGQTYRYRETSEIENQSDVCLDLSGEMRDATDDERQRTGGRKQVPDLASPVRNVRVSKNKLGQKGMVYATRIDAAFNFAPLELRRPGASPDAGPVRLGGR